jgi:hypothetical protein
MLEAALSNAEPLVRSHAARGLGLIRTEPIDTALQARASLYAGTAVRSEIDSVVSRNGRGGR